MAPFVVVTDVGLAFAAGAFGAGLAMFGAFFWYEYTFAGESAWLGVFGGTWVGVPCAWTTTADAAINAAAASPDRTVLMGLSSFVAKWPNRRRTINGPTRIIRRR